MWRLWIVDPTTWHSGLRTIVESGGQARYSGKDLTNTTAASETRWRFSYEPIGYSTYTKGDTLLLGIMNGKNVLREELGMWDVHKLQYHKLYSTLKELKLAFRGVLWPFWHQIVVLVSNDIFF